MKKFTFAIFAFFLFACFCKGQINWPTYYVVPASSGCNGVWAINTSATGGACGPTPYVYTFTPTNCATSAGIAMVGDTMFVPLCSVPCGMALMNANGQDCLASTGTTTGISSSESEQVKLFPSLIKAGETFTLEFADPAAEKIIQIFDNNGKHVYQIKTTDKNYKYTLPATASGVYYIVVTGRGQWTQLLKIAIQ